MDNLDAGLHSAFRKMGTENVGEPPVDCALDMRCPALTTSNDHHGPDAARAFSFKKPPYRTEFASQKCFGSILRRIRYANSVFETGCAATTGLGAASSDEESWEGPDILHSPEGTVSYPTMTCSMALIGTNSTWQICAAMKHGNPHQTAMARSKRQWRNVSLGGSLENIGRSAYSHGTSADIHHAELRCPSADCHESSVYIHGGRQQKGSWYMQENARKSRASPSPDANLDV
eukprot:3194116-Rhodomonas_salina.1